MPMAPQMQAGCAGRLRMAKPLMLGCIINRYKGRRVRARGLQGVVGGVTCLVSDLIGGKCHVPSRLQIGDTADCKSALRPVGSEYVTGFTTGSS